MNASISPSPIDAVVRARVYLHAGQLFASNVPCEISMVLGSCVSVCVQDASRGIGGANHFLLPLTLGGAQATPRIGSFAILELLRRVLHAGGRRGELSAKVFGGASLMRAPVGDGASSLGWKNVETARRVLAAEGVPIVAEDVGGAAGRRLLFRTDDGSAWVKRIREG